MTEIHVSIKDICEWTKWKHVKRALKYFYPTDKNNYEKLFYRFCDMKPAKVEPGDYLNMYGGICVDPKYFFNKWGRKFIEDLKSGDDYVVYGIDWVRNDKKWSVSFMPWNYLASLPITVDALGHYSPEDIIAHFLWEITWYGNEKQMAKSKKELMRRVKKVKNIIKK